MSRKYCLYIPRGKELQTPPLFYYQATSVSSFSMTSLFIVIGSVCVVVLFCTCLCASITWCIKRGSAHGSRGSSARQGDRNPPFYSRLLTSPFTYDFIQHLSAILFSNYPPFYSAITRHFIQPFLYPSLIHIYTRKDTKCSSMLYILLSTIVSNNSYIFLQTICIVLDQRIKIIICRYMEFLL